jgi:hypothetical protein
MRGRWLTVAVLALLVHAASCGARISLDELGELVFDAKALPGADKDYPLPEFPPEHQDEAMGGPEV